jgi:hypothetical protein
VHVMPVLVDACNPVCVPSNWLHPSASSNTICNHNCPNDCKQSMGLSPDQCFPRLTVWVIPCIPIWSVVLMKHHHH